MSSLDATLPGSGTRLTETTQDGFGSPDWSPDGTKIVFDSYREGADGIYVMNADGSGETLVSNRGGRDPAWSPDGTKILFGTGDIWMMNADGTGQINLTNTPTVNETNPAWQPWPGHVRPKAAAHLRVPLSRRSCPARHRPTRTVPHLHNRPARRRRRRSPLT